MSKNAKEALKAVALIKFFSEEEHYLAFKHGFTLMRTPHYYRRCEDRGRGDKNESCIGYWDKNLGDQVPIIETIGGQPAFRDVQSLLMYQTHEQEDSWLQSWCMVGPYNDFELSLRRMVEEFGSYFVVLPSQNLSKYADLIRQISGEQVRFGAVGYSDNPLDRSLTVKNSEYSYQKEFRFYVGKCSKDEIQDKKLHILGLNSLLLKAGSLKFSSPTGEVRYISQGGKSVVEA